MGMQILYNMVTIDSGKTQSLNNAPLPRQKDIVALDNARAQLAIEIISESNFIDYQIINQLLLSESFITKKRALQLLQFHKQTYDINDINLLHEVVKSINTVFTKKWTIIYEKPIFSSNAK